jgi:lipocalin
MSDILNILNILVTAFSPKEQDKIVVNYYKKFIGEQQLTYLLKIFKIDQFVGRWEQVLTSRSTELLGTGLDNSSVRATYSLNNDGTIGVLNSSYNGKFKKMFIEGTSRARDNTIPTCRTVKFDSESAIPFEGDYWILDISETFQTIIVVAPIITPYIPIEIIDNFGVYVLTKNRYEFWKNKNEVDRVFTVLNKYGFNKFWNEPVVSGVPMMGSAISLSGPITLPKTPLKFLDNIDGFNDSNIRCRILRENYKKQLIKSGYENIDLDLAFKNFPIDFSQHADLLGQLISQLPYTRYLEKTCDKNNLLIKLNNKSQNKELNFLSRILRQHICFENLILVFDYDDCKDKNFLSLNHILFNGDKITNNNIIWLDLLQSAYTELFLVIEIEHTLWHLNVEFIINTANNSLQNTEILKIFAMAEKNVFVTALEVKTILYETDSIFQQKLNDNKEFTEYVKIRNMDFLNNFNIDTIFNEYLLNGLNSKQNWITGMDSNIKIIKEFVNKVVTKSDILAENQNFINYIDNYNKKNNLDYKNVSIERYLQILFVVGSVFHSTTFEFTKSIFTDIIYNKKFKKDFYEIAIGTVIPDSLSFGDTSLYTGTVYKKEVDYLSEMLEINRKNIEEKLEYTIFKNYNYSTKDDIRLYFQANTYTTYI